LQIQDPIGHGNVDELAASGPLTRQQRGKHANGPVHAPAGEVGQEVMQNGRRTVLGPHDAQRPGHGNVVEIVPDQVLIGAVLAIPGNGAIDQAGVARLQRVVVYPQTLGHPGAEFFDNHVGRLRQPQEDVPTRRTFEVQPHTAFVAVEGIEG
jgi:hypothetical protein